MTTMIKGGIKAAACVLALLLWGTAQADKVIYVYSDPQGTPLAEADEQGNIIATFDYRPYGTQALGQPPSGPGYTGHVNDPDTGFVYMQARYYDPEVGRFLSVDPAGLAPGGYSSFNRFAYVSNNPVMPMNPSLTVGSDSDWQREMDAQLDGQIWHISEKPLNSNEIGGGLHIDLSARDARVLQIVTVQ